MEPKRTKLHYYLIFLFVSDPGCRHVLMRRMGLTRVHFQLQVHSSAGYQVGGERRVEGLFFIWRGKEMMKK